MSEYIVDLDMLKDVLSLIPWATNSDGELYVRLMEVYFKNSGSYGESAVNIPVTINNIPVGFVSEVNEEYVTCCLWDRYIIKERIGYNVCSKEQNIHSIGFEIGLP